MSSVTTIIKPRIASGTRDFGPFEMSVREKVFEVITDIYKQHGAVMIDTPAFELKQILTGKYGEDSKLIYDLADQGEGEDSHLALRYDLTVPFARYCAMQSVGRIKRYQIAKVWRRDHPIISRGRYREFYQCDFDIAGYAPTAPDAECLQIMREIFLQLDLGDFQISVSHRGLLDGMMEFCGVPQELLRGVCSAIDKLDKKSWEEVRHEMVNEKGLESDVADKIGEFIAIRFDRKEIGERLSNNKKAVAALAELDEIFNYLEAFGCTGEDGDGSEVSEGRDIVFDLSLARGLDYYTGVIFEARLTGTDVGSVGGGGRYDELIGMFAKRSIPSVGFSIGIERIFAILEKRDPGYEAKVIPTQVLVASAGGNLTTDRMKVCKELWRVGIRAEFMYKKNPKMQQQIEYCLDNQIDYMVVIGKNELDQGIVQIKDMIRETKTEVPRDEYIKVLQKQLVV